MDSFSPIQQSQQSLVTKFLETFKQRNLEVLFKIDNQQIKSQILVKLLILVSYFQQIYFLIHENIEFLFDGSIYQSIQMIPKITNIDHLIYSGNRELTLVIVYLIWALIVILVISYFYLMVQTSSNKGIKSLTNLAVIYIAVFKLFLSTVLFIPILSADLSIIVCFNSSKINPKNDCYIGQYNLHLVAALVQLLLVLFINYYFSQMFQDLNPYSQNPQSGPPNKVQLYQQVYQFLLVLMNILDQEGNNGYLKVMVYLGSIIQLMYIRFSQKQFYNHVMSYMYIVAESVLFWQTMILVLHFLFSQSGRQNLAIIYMFLGYPLSGVLFIKMFQYMEYQYLKSNINIIKDPI